MKKARMMNFRIRLHHQTKNSMKKKREEADMLANYEQQQISSKDSLNDKHLKSNDLAKE